MINLRVLILCYLILCISILACGQQYNRSVYFFEETAAFELAKAIEKEDVEKIETLVKSDTSLMSVANPISGTNGLALSIHLEKFHSFSKLLELGSNANYTNPYSRYSVLMLAIKYYDDYELDYRYLIKLLEYGADPNYKVDNKFVDEKGRTHIPSSAMHEAATLSLKMLKLLIKAGGDYRLSLGETKKVPFGNALSGFSERFEIVDYFIDSLKIDVHEPVKVWPEDSLHVQDYIKKYMAYIPGSPEDKKKKELIAKLEGMGVDFDNYNYKL